MKKTQFLLQTLGIICLALSVLSPDFSEWFFGVGVTAAATPVAGGTMTYSGIEDQKPEYFEEDISQKITKILPYKYPFDNMLRHLGNDKPAYNMKVQFEEDGYYKRDGAITALTLNDGGTSATATFTNHDNFSVDDIVIIPTVEITVDGKPRDLTVAVTAKNGATLTIKPVGRTNWTSSEPDSVLIPDFDVTDPVAAYRMANRKTESAAQNAPKSILPDREWNYAQIQMAQLEQSELSMQMRAKSGHQMRNANNTHALLDFRSSCEFAAKFGTRDTGVEDGDTFWTMNGFDKYVTKQITYPIGGIVTDNWVDWTRIAFSDVKSSDTKHLLCDQFLLADILKVPEVQRQLQGKQTEVVRGIKCRKIETDFGIILLTFDRSLQEIGKKNYGMLVDPVHVRRRVVEPMRTEKLELSKSGQRRVDAVRLLETYSLEVRVKDAHAIVKGTEDGGVDESGA